MARGCELPEIKPIYCGFGVRLMNTFKYDELSLRHWVTLSDIPFVSIRQCEMKR